MDDCAILGKMKSKDQGHGQSIYSQKGGGVSIDGFLLNSMCHLVYIYHVLVLFYNPCTSDSKSCQYQCSQLRGKTYLQNDPSCIESSKSKHFQSQLGLWVLNAGVRCSQFQERD